MALVRSQTPLGQQSADFDPHAANAQTDSSLHNFDDLSSDLFKSLYVAHVIGDASSYRQALAMPVIRNECSNQLISVRPGNLLNLLVERSNGQLISLCFLDARTSTVELDSFLMNLEMALPDSIETDVEIHALEAEIAQSTGYQITIESGLALLGTGCFYSQALLGLAASLAKTIKSICKSQTAEELDDLRSRLVNRLSFQVEYGLEVFRSRLDLRIISAIARSGNCLSGKSYNLYRRLGNAPKLRRLQAAEVFPLLGGILIESTRQFAHIRRSVDRKSALIPAAAKSLKVSQEVTRWMMSIEDVEYVGKKWLGKLDTLAKHLSHLCPEHRPKSIDDWFVFDDFISALTELETRTQGSPFKQHICVLPNLLAQVGKVGWHNASARFANMGADVNDLADMADLIDEIVQVLAEEIGEGGTLSEVLIDDLLPVVKKLFCSIGLTRQLKASLNWHRLMLEPDGAVDVDTPVASAPSLWSWPAPFEGSLPIDRQVAVCLTNPSQLKDEGKHMQHCVRNYTDHCLYYGSTIISIRDQDGSRLSTLELQLLSNKSETPWFVVRQHRGSNNSEPNQASNNAAQALLSILNGSSRLEIRQKLNRALQERRSLRRDKTPVSIDAHRIERLKRSLKVHVGYGCFYEAAIEFLSGGH